MRRCYAPLLGLLACTFLASTGCQSGGPRMAGLNPFHRPELTTFERPAERMAKVRQVALRSNGQNTPEQQAIVQELINPMASEPDPLIRQATLETVAKFNTPLTGRALIAGLSDNDPHVRRVSCRLLSERPTEGAVEALAARAQQDESFDVRVAAAEALGRVGADGKRLLPLLEDRDPAMQLAGVEAMRRATGRDLGGDVAAYVALAKGETEVPGGGRRPTAVANRLPEWVPFF